MRASLLISFVTALGLSVAAASTPDVEVAGPILTPGDAWTYRTNTSLGAGFYLDGHVTLTVASHAAASVEGVTSDAYRLRVTGSGTAAGTLTTPFVSGPASGVWVLTGQQTVESKGLKTLASVLDLEANGTVHIPFPVDFQLRVQNTTGYRFVEDAWTFPLAVGTSTIVRSQMNFSEDFSFDSVIIHPAPTHASGLAWSNVTYALNASAGVESPAGRFDAYPIRRSYADGTVNLLFYAPSAGNYVRTETYNGTERVATMELESYRYQALEPTRILGLTASDWAIVAILVTAGIVAIVLVRRWTRTPRPPPAAPPPSPP